MSRSKCIYWRLKIQKTAPNKQASRGRIEVKLQSIREVEHGYTQENDMALAARTRVFEDVAKHAKTDIFTLSRGSSLIIEWPALEIDPKDGQVPGEVFDLTHV